MVHDYIFENINKVIDYLSQQGWTLSKTYFGNAPYEVMDYGNDRLVYYPHPLGSPLFRGQNEFFDPCIASCFRYETDKIDKFIQSLKIEEFRIVTSRHPAIKNEIDGGIFYDYESLAQHYEFKTKMLDLTNSLPVAAFFAVTYREISGSYLPMGKSDKPGVLYFVTPSLEFFLNSNEGNPGIIPVGWQVFKRPGEQRAFVVDLSDCKNLNSIPGVFAFRFYQDLKISEEIFKLFQGGNVLFPMDVFAAKAAKIKDSMKFSISAFDNVFKNFENILTKEELIVALKDRGVKIQTKSPFEYTRKDIEAINKLYLSGKIEENRIATARLCCIP